MFLSAPVSQQVVRFQELPEEFSGFQEFVIVRGLPEIPCAASLNLLPVTGRVRGSDDEYRCILMQVAGPDSTKHLEPVYSWKIKIQEHDVRAEMVRVCLRIRNKLYGLFAVRYGVNVHEQTLHSDRFAQQQGIRQVVLNQQKI